MPDRNTHTNTVGSPSPSALKPLDCSVMFWGGPFANSVWQILQRQKKQMRWLVYNKQLGVVLSPVKWRPLFLQPLCQLEVVLLILGLRFTASFVLIVIYLEKPWKGVCLIWSCEEYSPYWCGRFQQHSVIKSQQRSCQWGGWDIKEGSTNSLAWAGFWPKR